MGLIMGCTIRHSGPSVTLLQFVDDCLIFLESYLDYVQNLRGILLMFKGISSLEVNLATLKLMGVRLMPNSLELASILGCQASSLPSIYLGLPLGAKSRSKHIWDPVIERFDRRLSAWKGRYLLKGSKLVLLKSVLSNLPIYTLSLFQALSSIIKSLEAIRRRFLWDSYAGNGKYPLVCLQAF